MNVSSPLGTNVQEVVSPLGEAGKGVSGPITIANCEMTGIDTTLLANYLWSDPLDIRPGLNQWENFVGSGGLYIISNKAQAQGAGIYSSYLECGVSDCTISTQFTTGNTTSTADIQMVVFRAVSSLSFWRLRRLKNPATIDLQDPTGATVASAAYPYVAGETFTMTVVLSGQNINCMVGATPLAAVSALNQAATKYGLYLRTLAPIIVFPTVDSFKVAVP